MRVAACDANTGRRGGAIGESPGDFRGEGFGDLISLPGAGRLGDGRLWGYALLPSRLLLPFPPLSLSLSLSLPSRRRKQGSILFGSSVCFLFCFFCFYSLCFKENI